MGSARLGKIISRDKFLKMAVIIATTPEAVAEIAIGPHEMKFVSEPIPPQKPQPNESRIILAR